MPKRIAASGYTAEVKFSPHTGGAYSEMEDVVKSEVAKLKAEPVAAQRTRLEREVVEKARIWKAKRDGGDDEKWSVHYVAMCEAIDDLEKFEAENKTNGS